MVVLVERLVELLVIGFNVIIYHHHLTIFVFTAGVSKR